MVVTMSEGKWGHSWVRVPFLDRSSGIQHGSPGSSCASPGDRAVLSAACLRHKNCRHGEEGLVPPPHPGSSGFATSQWSSRNN